MHLQLATLGKIYLHWFLAFETAPGRGPSRLAAHKAKSKVDKYSSVAAAMGATHLPFAVETFYRTGSPKLLCSHQQTSQLLNFTPTLTQPVEAMEGLISLSPHSQRSHCNGVASPARPLPA